MWVGVANCTLGILRMGTVHWVDRAGHGHGAASGQPGARMRRRDSGRKWA